MNKLYLFFVIALYCLITKSANATHLMGGDVYYTFISDSTYQVKLYVYRDCNGNTAAIDNSITYRIFNGDDSSLYQSRTVTLTHKEQITSNIPNCVNPTGVCVETGYYIDTITVGNNPEGYHILWFRGERNNAAIDNLVFCTATPCNCGTTWSFRKRPFGQMWHSYIPPNSYENSSPRFFRAPVPYMCVGDTNTFNHLAYDPEGDSLVFSIIHPYSSGPTCPTAPGSIAFPIPNLREIQLVTFATGYSSTAPLGTSSPITINSQTGEIIAVPQNQGNYVLAIQVEEYRVDPVTKQSTYMGRTIRDLQFIVGSCPSVDPPVFANDSEGYTRRIEHDDTLCFNVGGVSLNGDTVYIWGESAIFESEWSTISPPYATFDSKKGKSSVSSEFCWISPGCANVTTTSPHIVNFILADENCNQVQRTYSIYVDPKPIQKPSVLSCVESTDSTSVQISWIDTNTHTDFLRYNIYKRAGPTGPFQLLDTIYQQDSLNTWTDSNAIQQNSTFYSYYVRTANSCFRAGLSTDTISTILLESNLIEENALLLNWNKYSRTYNDQYYILANTGNGFEVMDSTFLNSYIFSRCQFEAQFQVQTFNSIFNCQSNSNTSANFLIIDTLSPLVPIPVYTSYTDNDSILFSFSDPEPGKAFKFLISKSVNGQQFEVFDSMYAQTEQDIYNYYFTNFNNANSYCFKVNSVDSCSNSNEALFALCPAHISGEAGNMQSIVDLKYLQGLDYDSVYLQKLIDNVWTNIAILDSNINRFIDSQNVYCNTDYHYRILTKLNDTSANSFSNIITITPFDTIPPGNVSFVYVSAPDNNTLEIAFEPVSDPDVNKYEIQLSTNGQAYIVLDTVYYPDSSVYVYTHNSIDPVNNSYCYRIYAIDSCSDNRSLLSDSWCNVILSGSAGNLLNNLNWIEYLGPDTVEYQVQRLDNGNWTDLSAIITDTTYTDDSLLCNVPYLYRIQSINNSILTYSNSVTLVPYDTIPPLSPIITGVSVISENSILLNWEKSSSNDVDKYIILRSINGISMQIIDSTGDVNEYTDININPFANVYCYAIMAMDSCMNNLSDTSVVHCAVNLRTFTMGCEQEIGLEWSKYIGWNSPINYEIEYFTTDTSAFQSITTITDTAFTDTTASFPLTYCYRITVYDPDDVNNTSYSNIACDSTFHPPTPEIYFASKFSTSETNGDIIIGLNNTNNLPYIAYRKLFHKTDSETNFNLLFDSIPLESDTLFHNNINTKTADHHYYLVNVDSCGNESFASNIHKTMDLSVDIGQLLHQVSWTQYLGFDVLNYVVEKLGANGFEAFDTLPPTDTSFVNYPAPCNLPQFYRIKALGTNGYYSYSDTAGNIALDTIPPDAPELVNVSVIDNQKIAIDFIGADSLDLYGFEILRSFDKVNYSVIDFFYFTQASDTFYFEDTNSTLQNQACYVIVSLDSCLNVTASDTFCHIKIHGLEQNLQNTISWDPFKGYQISSYHIEALIEGNWQLIDSVSATDTFYIHEDIACNLPWTYRITAYEDGADLITFSDHITLMPFDTTTPIAPQIDYITVRDYQSIDIQWQLSEPRVLQYEIQVMTSGGNWQVYDTTGVQAQLTISGLTTSDSLYCVQIIAIDSCAANRSEPSAMHCAIKLDGNPANLANQLYWTDYVGFDSINAYYIQQFVSGSWVNIDTLPPNVNNYTHEPLPCNLEQTYRILAENQSGNFFSVSDSINLMPFDTTAPIAPQIDYITVRDYQSIDIQWELSEPRVLLYEIQLRTSGGSWQVYDTTGVQTQLTISGLTTTDSLYCVQIIAIDSCEANRSEPSAMHCAIKLDGYPANLANQLYWTDYVGFDTIHSYFVQELVNGNWIGTDSLNGNENAYRHQVIPCNIPRTYRIAAYNGVYFSFSDTLTLVPYDTIPPDEPFIHFVTVESDNSVRINWSYDENSDAKYFEIWRQLNENPATLINTPVYDTTYLDENLNTLDNTYSYFIIAIDSCDGQNRSQPSDLHRSIKLTTTTGACYAMNELNWNAYEGFAVAMYDIYRSQDNDNFVLIASVNASDTNWIDTMVSDSFNYCYYLVANADGTSGFSSFSNESCVTTFVFTPAEKANLKLTTVTETGINNGAIGLYWLAADINDPYARGYNIYHAAGDTLSGWQLIQSFNDLSDTSFTFTNINTGSEINYFYITVFNLCDVESERSNVHRPVNLDVINNNLEAILNWTPYLGMNVSEYTVYRSKNGGTYRSIANIPALDTFYTDTDLSCLNNYSYKIKTTDVDKIYLESWSDTVAITAYDTILPESAEIIRASVTETAELNGEIIINFMPATDKNRSSYEIYISYNNSAFTLLDTWNNTGTSILTYTVTDLNTIEDEHSFYIVSVDSCGNKAVPLDTHSVINLKAETLNNLIRLEWTHYEGWDQFTYLIQRKRISGNWQTLDTVNGFISTYTDNAVRCDSVYIYRIAALHNDTIMFSYSNLTTVKAISTDLPEEPNILQVTVTETGITDGVVRLDWMEDTTGSIFYYKIYRSVNLTNWQLIADEINNFIYFDSILNTQYVNYYYRIDAVDSCLNISDENSVVHGTMVLKTSAGEEEVSLSWNAYTGWQADVYYIERDGNIINALYTNDSNYIDTDVICMQDYSYRVLAVKYIDNDSLWSYSNIDTASPRDTTSPDPVYLRTATVSVPNEEIFIEWEASASHDVAYYEVYRRKIGSYDYELIYTTASVFERSYTDRLDDIKERFCYIIKAIDHCDNVSDESNIACIIVPKGKAEILVNEIKWDPYMQWAGNIERYRIFKSEDGSDYKQVDVVPGRDSLVIWYDEDLGNFIEDYCYIIEAIETGGVSSRSTKICLKQDALVFIPNSFSPQATPDINDTFEPGGMFIRNYEMQIFNRWGQLVYETKESKAWDGKNKRGNYVDEGVYIYIIKIEGYSGEYKIFTGNVTIIR